MELLEGHPPASMQVKTPGGEWLNYAATLRIRLQPKPRPPKRSAWDFLMEEEN